MRAALPLPACRRCSRPWPRDGRDLYQLDIADLTPADREHLDRVLPRQRVPGADAARGRSRRIRSPTSPTSASRSRWCCGAPMARSASPGSRCPRSCRAGCRFRAESRSCRWSMVIGANLEALFPGVEILGCYPFRITRNTDLEIDTTTRRRTCSASIQEEVRNRRFAEVVRHRGARRRCRTRSASCCWRSSTPHQDRRPAPLTADDLYEVPGLLDTRRSARPRGARPAGAQGPALPPGDARRGSPAARNIFDVIREGDLLRAPSLRQLHDLRRALHPDRGGRSRRASPSSSRSTGPAATPASPGCWPRPPSAASRWRC